MNRTLQITAPCRLHFGLLRFAQASGPSYGGLGMMLDQPATVVEMQLADTWQATGPNAERALAFAQRAARHWPDTCESPLSIHVRQAPPAHTGLGSGTQLALAVARGVSLLGNRNPNIDELSAAVGRGQRSAIGSHGFLHGGLLWETGRLPNESLAQLTRHLDVPEQWRILLITPPHNTGLHGIAEVDAFDQLLPVPPEVTKKLQCLANENILPAVEQSDFNTFSESIYEYGHLAGSCFAPMQGGAYASPDVASLVSTVCKLGYPGVGQSSWGPTVFAVVADTQTAETLVSQLRQHTDYQHCTFTITMANNSGAKVRVIA